jgi:hypothetical protein
MGYRSINALAEAVNAAYKTELINHGKPWRSIEEVKRGWVGVATALATPGPPQDTEISGLGVDQSCPSAKGRGRRPRVFPLGSEQLSNEARKTVIREWARRNGHPVSDRGRIPRAVTDAFNSA